MQTGVSTATNITLTFNNAIDPATVNATTLPVLIANGINQQIAGSYQVTGNQIVFTPDSPFPTNTTIYVDSNYGPADLAGDLAGDNYTPLLVFTTGGTATPASAPFQVVTFSPAANATAVGLRAPVAATFNRSINLTSVNSGDFGLFAGDGQSPWCSNYQHSQDDATILFNCGVMPSSTLMTAQLGNGLTDWQGNGLVPYTSAFTTTYFDSNTNGSIISSQPGSGAGGVANNVPLVLYTNLPINSNTVSAGLQVAENGTPLPGSTEVIDNGYAMVFTPSANLTPGALIQWWTTPSLMDATYNVSFTGASGYFYVAADTSTLTPTIQVISPQDGANAAPNSIVDVQFNTPLNPSTVNSTNIYLYDYDSGLNIAATYSMPQPNEVRIVPSGILNTNDYIMLYVTPGLTSSTSVPAASVGYFGEYFYTNVPLDTTLPTVTSAVPFNGATNVGINVTPGVIFNKTIDPVSVNNNTFTVSTGGTPLAGSYWFSSNDSRVEFVPNLPLPVGTALTMTLNGVLDPVGNPVNFSSTFTTGPGPDVTSPYVVSSSASNYGSIPDNATISVQFSESMDVTTFNTPSTASCGGINLYLYDTLLGQCVPATLSWSSDQTVAYLVPSSPLAAGRTYYFYVNSGADLAGNAMNPNIGWTIYADLEAPSATTVVDFNPVNGATGVGTNTIVEAQFSAPVDPTTLSGVTLKSGSTLVSVTPVLYAGNTILQLMPPAPLADGANYTITVAGVKDTTGISVPTASSSFGTGSTYDITPLALVSMQPTNYSTVGTNVAPQFQFNKPLNPTSVNPSDFQIYTTNPLVQIPIAVTLSADRMTVTLTPLDPLQPGTEYQFGFLWNNGAQDLDGNSLYEGWYYFYTSGGPDTSALTVAVNPMNGATGIPLNAQVIAIASAQIDPTTVGQNAIQLSSGGNSVTGTVSLVNNQEISFAPSSNLAAGAVYTVNVANFTDANGNAVTPSTTTFTAGAAASTPGFSWIQANDIPSYGATGVSAPTSTTISLQFTQLLDPATVNINTMPVMVGSNNNQSLAGTWAVNGNVATFTPSAPYPYGATIYVGACGGPTDVLGEVFQNGQCLTQYLDTFTIVSGSGNQVGPLQVLSVNPAPGAANVLTNTPVSITFSNSVANGSWYGGNQYNNIQLYAGQGVQENGNNISISSDGRTLTFNGGALYNGTNYTITIPAGGITDDWGNTLTSTYTSTFTTTSNSDFGVGAGSVIGTTPGNTSGIPTNTLLTLYINRQVDASTLAGSLTVTVNGSIYLGTVTIAADGYEVQYAPNSPFPNNATVQWWFSNVEDANGVTLNSDSGYFFTAAPPTAPGSAPTVVALSPPYGDSTDVPTNAEFDIEFSLPLLASTVNSTNVSVYGPNGYLPTTAYTVSLPSPDIVRVQANSGPLGLNDYEYVCVGSGVTGANSVPFSGGCWTDYFYTTYGPDTSSGTVTVGPPNGAVNVGTNAYIRLSFSKAVDQTSFNSTNLQITTGGNPVSGSWSYYSPSGDIMGAYFYPTNPLAPNTTYTVTVSGLLDYAGNAFNSPTSTFTAGPMPEYNSPNVSLDFASGATGIATNASFTCRYSEAMDPSTITSSGLLVWSEVDNAPVPATITISPDWMSATITPTAPLYMNTQYYYACDNAIDLTGNQQNNASADFTTASGPSSAGPVLVSANPPSGSTSAPLNTGQGPWDNTSFDLLFSEPVSTASLATITLTSQQQLPTAGPVISIPVAAFPEYGSYIASIQLGSALLPTTLYTFNFAGVTDVNGNPVSGTTTTSFTTGSSYDYTLPTISSTVPANGAANVSVNGPFSITFSKAMNPTLFPPSASGVLYLQTHNTDTVVPATVTMSSDDRTATIVPTAPLAPSTIYDMELYTGPGYAYDIAGNIESSYGTEATFTTGEVSAVNGTCGSANNGSFAMAPNTNLCSAGTASLVTNSGSWTWTCNGQYGGTNASCSANVQLANSCSAQQAGLVSWWPGNNNANDLIGGNNGTLENGAGFGLGEVDDAFSLNGNNQYVLIGQPVPSNLQIQNAITLSAWIYPNAYPTTDGTPNGGQTWGMIEGSEEPSNNAAAGIFFNGYQSFLPDVPIGAIDFDLADGSAWHQAFTTTQVPLNQWTLVTATATANNPMQIYFNGVAQPTVNNGTTPFTGQISYNGDWFAIGQDDEENWPFNGLIDETQIYSSALTTAQIQAIYQAGSAGVCQVQTPTTTTVSSSLNPAYVGTSVTLTATIAPSASAGSVTFMDGTTTLGTAPVSGGQAQFSTSSLNLGSHSITALYSGDTSYAGSNSAPLTQTVIATGACYPQPSGLIDWWPGNGNTSDIIGGNNATVVGTVGYTTGEVGQAFNFDGTAGHLTAAASSINVASGTEATVAFWMYWENDSTESMPIAFGNTTFFYDLLFWDGAFGFNTGNSDILGISSSGLANEWVQVTAVFTNGDPHSNELYINGVQQTLAQEVGSTPNSNQLLENAYIGGVPNFYYFYGDIDEVQIYNGALTAAQIQAIYNAGSAGVCQ